MTRHSSDNGVRGTPVWLGLITSALVAGTFSSQINAAPDAVVTPPPSAIVARSAVFQEWRKSMLRNAASGRGCFRADYPEKQWKPTPCVTASPHPYITHSTTGPGPETVGNGTDYSAGQGGGLISYGEGSFGTSAITSETQGSTADHFSLQLNTNFFSTSACSGVSNCSGWQQYIFSNPGSGTAYLFIQYWLLNHPSNCPSGYTYYAGNPGLPGCYMNSAAASVPIQPLNNLSALTLTGTAVSGGLDQLTLSTGTSLYSTYGEDTVLNASNGWTSAEFNVFGDCCGNEATFGSGTLLAVETMVSNGVSTSAPSFALAGTTGETNNLTLASLVCSVADPNGPYIWFQESYGATTASSCPVTPISLAAPTVTTTETGAGTEIEHFSFTWPSVSGATYYTISKNGAASTITGNSAGIALGCQKSAVVTLSSCNAAGCGWPETVLSAKNTSPCN